MRVGLVHSEVADILNQPWIRADQEQRAVALAATSKELQSMRRVVTGTPIVLGDALVIPAA